MDLNYEEDTRINHNALDVEIINQANLYMKYMKEQAMAKLDVSQSKENLAIVRSELYQDIIKLADKKGDKKPTEATISSEIEQTKEYRDALEDYREAEYDYDIISAGVRAIGQKKDLISDAVRLWAGGYFAGPKMPRDIDVEVLKEKKRQQAMNAYDIDVKPKKKRRRK